MPVQDFTAKSLEILDSAEDFVLGTATDAMEAVSGYVPNIDVPLIESLPKASAIVDDLFDFAGEVLASQREFVGKLITAAEELVPNAEATPATAV